MRSFSFRPSLRLRGRGFKGLKGFAGKPFHPPLTDVVVGAYVVAAVADIVSFLLGEGGLAGQLHRTALFAYLGGLLAAVPAVVTGWVDWLDTQKGTQIRRTANAHAWGMIVVNLCVVLNILLRWRSGMVPATASELVLSVVVLVGLAVGGTIGGSLVFDYGFNVVNSTDHAVWHESETDVMPGEHGGS